MPLLTCVGVNAEVCLDNNEAVPRGDRSTLRGTVDHVGGELGRVKASRAPLQTQQ